jgi:hypothetical protein
LDAICLIAAPRTGTNHLSEVLKNLQDLAAFLDIFDEREARGIDPEMWPTLRRLTGIDFANLRDPALIGFAHEKPTRWLDALEQAAIFLKKRVMSFKLIARNLPNEVIEREIVTRHGLRMILVVRKQVDAYVSWRKAIELGRWRDADTTGMRLKLEIDPFERWLDEQERWYDVWRNYLNKRFMPCPVLRYELDIDQPAERVVRRFAAAAAQVGVTLRPPAAITHTGYSKQDRATNMADKVTNWAEFSREIFARGLERRAFGYPI